MNGVGLRVSDRDLQEVVGKLGGRTTGRHLGEMPARLGLDTAEHISGPATPIFAAAAGHAAWLDGQSERCRSGGSVASLSRSGRSIDEARPSGCLVRARTHF